MFYYLIREMREKITVETLPECIFVGKLLNWPLSNNRNTKRVGNVGIL